MIHSDKAIESLEQDLLGRKEFSKRIAKDILGWKDTDSLVIGLYGKWGDGKSSVKNFIKDLLKNPAKFEEEMDEKQIPTVIEFNPWIFSNQGNLIQSFLLEVGKELGQKGDKKDKEIAQKLGLIRLYLGTMSKIGKKTELVVFRTVLPAVGLTGAVFLDKVFSFSPAVYAAVIIVILIVELLTFSENVAAFFEKFYKEKSELLQKSLDELKEDIKLTLSDRERKILFVFDDIDRLSPEEIKDLFQLIKINLDLPNLIYLLVMDVETVGKIISSQGVDGAEYIEKIVQFPISLPKADDKKLQQFLFAQLDEIIKFFSEDKWDKDRWTALYHSGLSKMFLKRGNLRVIKRPVNQIWSAASLISPEVDPVDFLGIRTIECFYPQLYNFISNNKDAFTTVNRHSQYDGKKLDGIRQTIRAELTKIPDPFVEDVLLELFPSLKSVIENYSFGDTTEKEWKRQRRICSPDHFDTYFFLDVPTGELHSAEVTDAISAMKTPGEFSKLLQTYLGMKEGEEKDIRKFLATLLDHVESFPAEEDAVTKIVTSLLDIGDEVTRYKARHMFDFGGDMDLMRVVYFYLRSLKLRRISIFTACKKAIRDTKSLYGAVNFLSINDPRREKTREEDTIFSDEEAAELAAECVKKIKKAQKEGRLSQEENLIYILYRWKEWGNEKEVSKFVNTYKRSRVALADFISRFMAITLSSQGSITKQIPKIQFASLKEFFDLEYLKKHMDKLDLEKVPEQQRDAIELFKKDFSKKDDSFY